MYVLKNQLETFFKRQYLHCLNKIFYLISTPMGSNLYRTDLFIRLNL